MNVPGQDDRAGAHFPAEAASAAAARRFVAATLKTWRQDRLEEVATLLVSELVANVVLHAGTDLDVRLRLIAGGVRVEVHDQSPRLPDRKRYSATSAPGRGLVLVDQLARAWGSEPMQGGKAVWFELDETTTPPPAQDASAFGWDDRMRAHSDGTTGVTSWTRQRPSLTSRVGGGGGASTSSSSAWSVSRLEAALV